MEEPVTPIRQEEGSHPLIETDLGRGSLSLPLIATSKKKPPRGRSIERKDLSHSVNVLNPYSNTCT
jgi:hypothetical protein